MADNDDANHDDYVEVDAVVRIPKGERLADSKKSEGWSRGFTPKSPDKGPEHVEIRIKDPSEEQQPVPDPDPEVIFIYADSEAEAARTREEEEVDELVRVLVALAMLKAAEWAAPYVRRWWTTTARPFLTAKRESFTQWRARRRTPVTNAENESIDETVTEPEVEVVGEVVGDVVGEAVAAFEANMTSAEARRHLIELLLARHFVEEKERLLRNARISDDTAPGAPAEVLSAMRALEPEQVRAALESLLTTRPTVLTDLEQLLEARRAPGPLELSGDHLERALRLTDNE